MGVMVEEEAEGDVGVQFLPSHEPVLPAVKLGHFLFEGHLPDLLLDVVGIQVGYLVAIPASEVPRPSGCSPQPSRKVLVLQQLQQNRIV